jgi:hypothetical protein
MENVSGTARILDPTLENLKIIAENIVKIYKRN